MKRILGFLILTLILLAQNCDRENEPAHEGHDHGGHDHGGHSHGPVRRTGAGMAVLMASRERGIMLSPRALETIGAEFRPSAGLRAREAVYRIPDQAIVEHMGETELFIRRGNWILPVAARRVRGGAQSALVRNDDEIAIEGAALLRLAYIEAFGASGTGHGH